MPVGACLARHTDLLSAVLHQSLLLFGTYTAHCSITATLHQVVLFVLPPLLNDRGKALLSPPFPIAPHPVAAQFCGREGLGGANTSGWQHAGGHRRGTWLQVAPWHLQPASSPQLSLIQTGMPPQQAASSKQQRWPCGEARSRMAKRLLDMPARARP